MTSGLKPELLELLAESISHHAAQKHLTDFNVARREDLFSHIKNMLNDPSTEFIINRSKDTDYKNAVVFFNSKTQSVLAFNPQQLEDPISNAASSPGRITRDNFAGTLYRKPKLNADGMPSTGKKLLTEAESKLAFERQIENLKSQMAKSMDIPKQLIVPQRIGNSSEWAKHIGQYEDEIREGLQKGLARLRPAAQQAVETAAKNADEVSDVTKGVAGLAKKFSKIIPLAGACVAAYEAYDYIGKAEAAIDAGRLRPEALAEYKAICCGHVAAGLGGFVTSTAGEGGVMLAFKAWSDKYNVSAELREELAPDGLLKTALDKMGADTAGAKAAARERQMAVAPTQSDMLAPQESDFIPPEAEAVMERLKVAKELDDRLLQANPADKNYGQIKQNADSAEEGLVDLLHEMEGYKGLQPVRDYGYQEHHENLEKEKALEPDVAPDYRPEAYQMNKSREPGRGNQPGAAP